MVKLPHAVTPKPNPIASSPKPAAPVAAPKPAEVKPAAPVAAAPAAAAQPPVKETLEANDDELTPALVRLVESLTRLSDVVAQSIKEHDAK